MSRLTANPKLLVALVTLALFFLLNSLPRSRTEMGGRCVTGLDSLGGHAQLDITDHGWPQLAFVVTLDGCFNDRKLSIDWLPRQLALNLLTFAFLGWVLYGLVVRFRSLWFHA